MRLAFLALVLTGCATEDYSHRVDLGKDNPYCLYNGVCDYIPPDQILNSVDVDTGTTEISFVDRRELSEWVEINGTGHIWDVNNSGNLTVCIKGYDECGTVIPKGKIQFDLNILSLPQY